MPYKTIRFCSLKLKSDLPKQEFYVMKFPEEAKDVIRRLAAKQNGTSFDKTSLPVKSLYKGLRLAPGLIHIGKISPKRDNDEETNKEKEEFWLYSPQQLDTKKLSAILAYWIETEFPDKPSKRGQVISAEEKELATSYLSEEKLIWEKKEVSYTSKFPPHPNKTPNLSNSDYVWLPHIIAAKLSQPKLKFEVDGQQLQFYRSVPSNGKGAELISWQPLNYTENGQTYYYSIVLTLSIILEPGLPYPRFDITPSIRRWLSINDCKLSNNHGSNAYIRAKLNWGKGLNPDDLTEYFINCRMVLKKGLANWDENLGELLAKLDIISNNPQEILANPSSAFNDKPNIGITYKEGMKPKHKVAKGVPTVNTDQLLKQIDNVLTEYFEPIYCQRQNSKTSKQPSQFFDLKKPENNFDEPLYKKKAETEKTFEVTKKNEFKKKKKKIKNCLKKKTELESDYQKRREELVRKQEIERLNWKPKLEETEEDFQLRLKQFNDNLSTAQAKLRSAIRSSIGEQLTIWIWHIKSENLEKRLKAIKYCLGLPKAEPGSHSFPEGLTVNICVSEVASLAQRLDLSPESKPNSKEREKAINKRKSEVANLVESPKSELLGKVGIWFELYDKKHWKFVQKDKEGEQKKYWLAPWGDPKRAIRMGFSDEGFVSKFITPERKSYYQKAICSFVDLLRSLGVRLEPSKIQLSNVDKDTPINEVGLRLINRTSQTGENGKPQLIPVMVKMCSLTNETSAIFPGITEWIPYDEALTRINNDGDGSINNDDNGKARIRTFIEYVLKTPELRGKPTILYCEAENIRQVWTWLQDTQIDSRGLSFAERKNQVFDAMPELRVIRIRSGNETAEWYGIDGEKLSGFTTGIFKNSDNDRVFFSIGEKPATMKVPKDFSRIDKPGKVWHHPSIMEITIGYRQKDDDPLELAAIAHQSRKGVLQYEDFLQVPRVLHYAKQMGDYVLMLDDDDDEQSDN